MKTIRRRRRRSSLEARLVAYSAMAGAALATAPVQAADCLGGAVAGTVCYTNFPDLVVTGYGEMDIDLDGNGDPEFRVVCSISMTSDAPPLEIFRYVIARVAPDATGDVGESALEGFSSALRGPSGQHPGALVSGDEVGAPGFGTWASTPGVGWPLVDYFYCTTMPGNHSFGNFRDRGDRFVGLRARFDDGAEHFAWLRVNILVNGRYTNMTVKDYAFNMVPGEPLSISLAALAELFADDFESGSTSEWSATTP